MEGFLGQFYFILLIACFIFSIVTSIMIYNRDKYKLIDLTNKFKSGWGLYKVKFKKIEENFIISPYSNEEYLYYHANLKYEDRVERVTGKKNKLDVKFYPKNKEKFFHNNVLIQVLNKEININTDKLKLSLETHIDDKPNITLGENERILYLEETFIKENQEYYAMIQIKDKEINIDDIRVSEEVSNFKHDFFFHLALLWFPTISFLGVYVFII